MAGAPAFKRYTLRTRTLLPYERWFFISEGRDRAERKGQYDSLPLLTLSFTPLRPMSNFILLLSFCLSIMVIVVHTVKQGHYDIRVLFTSCTYTVSPVFTRSLTGLICPWSNPFHMSTNPFPLISFFLTRF